VQHNPPSRFLSEIDGDFQQAGSPSYDDGSRYLDEPVGFGLAGQAASNEPRYVPELFEGDSVRHKLFGVGTVMEVDGDNAVIYFKGKGAKKLNISFAPVEKL
jgi:hypothetical protein